MSNYANLINIGMSPSLAMGMVYVSSGYSMGLLMDNSVRNKALSQLTNNASVDQCCALMISIGAAGAAKGQ
jgi:hypothetical protein